MKLLSKNVLFSISPNPKNAPRNNIRCDCPFCGKSQHFFILNGTKKIKGVDVFNPWMCQKCKETGDIESLLKKLNQEHLIEGERISSGLKVLNLGIQQSEEVDDWFYVEPRTIRMPIGTKPLEYDDGRQQTQYLIDRGFTRQDFDETKPHYNEIKQKLLEYVMFPIEKDFTMRAYISRYSLTEDDEDYDEEVNRYNNSISPFSNLIYNYDRLTSKTKIIILVEGIFDAIAVMRKLCLYDQDEIVCLATFGNKISRDQVHLLRKFKSIETCYLMYDVRDSVETMKKYGGMLSEYFQMMICYLKSGDPDESSAKQITQSIYNSESYVAFKYHKIQEGKKF